MSGIGDSVVLKRWSRFEEDLSIDQRMSALRAALPEMIDEVSYLNVISSLVDAGSTPVAVRKRAELISARNAQRARVTEELAKSSR
jgi:hypothetical protein